MRPKALPSVVVSLATFGLGLLVDLYGARKVIEELVPVASLLLLALGAGIATWLLGALVVGARWADRKAAERVVAELAELGQSADNLDRHGYGPTKDMARFDELSKRYMWLNTNTAPTGPDENPFVYRVHQAHTLFKHYGWVRARWRLRRRVRPFPNWMKD